MVERPTGDGSLRQTVFVGWKTDLSHATESIEVPHLPLVESTYDYSLYGLHLRSPIRLTLPEVSANSCADVEFLPGAGDQFAEAVAKLTLDPSDWIHEHELTDGWSYIRYDEMFDFLVAPSGDRIFYRLLGLCSAEAFQTYALGRVFSFALVKMGFEPLHAATIVVDGRAVAFLGASTFGKSSLAACFVAGNHPLLTDDVLRLQEEAERFVAFPGPPRLKLFPKVARLFLGEDSRGLKMNPKAAKFVFPLSPLQSHATPVPLTVIYAVTAPRDVHRRQRVHIGSHSPMEALVKVLSFTHNHQLTDPGRLQRQFAVARRLIEIVSVRKLSYPRVLSSLPEVRDSVLADLQRRAEW
jgi:hypothetical protein